MNNKYCIVIPIYKTRLIEYEVQSLKQCCKIFSNYHIAFVTHKNLDCSEYNNICKEFTLSFSYEYFSKYYFSGIPGYNSLLLSKSFYKRFIGFNYILLYHLDSYVFREEIDYWCGRGFDYIGAPWLKLNAGKTLPEFNEPPAVGNGGFSLRNVNNFIKKHNIKFILLSFIHYFQSYYNIISHKSKNKKYYFIPRFFLRFLLILFKSFFFKFNDYSNNEDLLWAKLFLKNGILPSPFEAIKFSFEDYPEYLYNLNNNELPFGCHAWFTYHNYPFYTKNNKFIITNEKKHDN